MTSTAGTEAIDLVVVIDDRRINPDRGINSDRRSSPRKRVLKGGRTAWQNGDSTECIIHNLSASRSPANTQPSPEDV